MLTEESEVQVSKIVDEVKSRGLFDQLRRDCLRNVETESAFRRLKEQVDKYCARFLADQRWHPGLNKTELRDRLRDRLMRAKFVNDGVKELVERVVAYDKMQPVLYKPVERIVYDYLGLPYDQDDEHDHHHHQQDQQEDHRRSKDTDVAAAAAADDEEPQPPSKRARRDDDHPTTIIDAGAANPTSSLIVEQQQEEETPVQDEEPSQPPLDPAPSSSSSSGGEYRNHQQSQLSLLNHSSDGEISVTWHVTSLSPNPAVATADHDDHHNNDHVMNMMVEEEELESPAHEAL